MNRMERNTILFCCLLQNRHILGIKRTLACVIQNISLFVNVRMLRAGFKRRRVCANRAGPLARSLRLATLLKRQIPKLNAVIRFIRDLKSLILQEFGVRQERLLLSRCQNTQPLQTLLLTILDAGVQKICRIPMSLEGARHPQAVNVHISVGVNRNPRVFCRHVLDEALAALHTFQENEPLIKPVRKPRLLG